MNLQEIAINKIKPDPEQPRKSFDMNEIHEMAKSIKTTGIINPIEVDPKYIIITGERRWRAAKEAGLTHVPCKVMKIDEEERFTRQVIENIHHNTMNDFDTALALQKMVSMSRRVIHPKAAKSGPHANRGIEWLSEKTGKSRQYIGEKLALLSASQEFQKAVKAGKLTPTYLRILARTPEEHKSEIEKKLLAGEFRTAEGGLEVVGALRRNPARAEEILNHDYSRYATHLAVAEKVSQVAPRVTDQIVSAIQPSKQLGEIVDKLVAWLDKNSPQSVGRHNIKGVITNLVVAEDEIKKWLKKQ